MGNVVMPKAICAACGSYAQNSAVYLSQKYSDIFMETPYCIYCLSHALNRSVEDLKAEYNREKNSKK